MINDHVVTNKSSLRELYVLFIVTLSVFPIRIRLFWSDWETGGIHSVDKQTGKDVVTVALGIERPTSFALFKAVPPG